MRARYFLLAITFVFGMSMLSGITGNVVSETCCMGDTCDAVNECTVLQQPSSESSYVGVLLVLLSVALAGAEIAYARRQKERNKRTITRVF